MPASLSAVDEAIAQGELALGTTSPNPPVGAVIVRDGEIVGKGHTQPAGGAHAEVCALAEAGDRARGAQAIVTLEPCDHTGRTGPCTQALIDAGIASVRYLCADPNPAAAGGAQTLKRHGIEVLYEPREVDALRPWLGALKLGRPHVTLKMAQTLDGFCAAVDGTSQWITGESARAHVHRDRLRRDAIIIGTGTALADNPSLTARPGVEVEAQRQPRRVVIGKRDVAKATNLKRLGFEQYPDPHLALSALWDSGARNVLVEGGPHLAGSFIQAGLVDAMQVYIAPKILGAGLSALQGWNAGTLKQAENFQILSHTQLGEDMLVELRRVA